MRVKSLLFPLLLAVLLLAPQTLAQDNQGADERMGAQIAGAWLGEGEFSVDIGCDGTFDLGPFPFTDSQAFGAEGLHTAVNPANPNTGNGTWMRTGRRQVRARDINFGVDATPNGTLTSVAIISVIFDFDPGFRTATSTFAARVFGPTDDPLEDEPFACSLGQHTLLRKVDAKWVMVP